VTETSPTKSVLFVCLGNICRSPTGEGVFRSLLSQHPLTDNIIVDSAGTIGFHTGKSADARMQSAARARGYELLSKSRQITYADLETFDLIIAMDRDNFNDIKSVHPAPTAEIKLLSEFLGDDWPTDVPDPYRGSDEGFEYVLDMIESACPRILEYLS
jgi:protein-tyrosine phosphatase